MEKLTFKILNENKIIKPDILDAAYGDELLARILINRGIDTVEKVKEFINLDLYRPTEPSDFPGMDKAVEIIAEKIKSGEKIAVYGDYDVDGVTSTVMLVQCLKEFTDNVTFHVPDRFTEGYGMNKDVIMTLIRNDVKLIISCDCGISNIEEIGLARSNGVDIVLTDHHSIPPKLPDANVILNPKLLNDDNPAHNLSGCGMAYFLCRALLKHLGREDLHSQYLDIVLLSIIADAVTLTGENRYLLKKGLPYLLNSKRVGLSAIYSTINENGIVSMEDIPFQVTPRINAAGRLDSARLPIELLLCNDVKKAEEMAERLNALNAIRKDIQQRIVDEAVQITENEKAHKNIIIIYNDSWHHGVLGIAAGKLCEKYKKPVILLSLKEDGVTIGGSARSVENVDIYQLLSECREYMDKFGGHPMAAGLSLKKQNLGDFTAAVESVMEKMYPSKVSIEVYADACLELSEINTELLRRIDMLAPYGEGFAQPVFLSKSVEILSDRVNERGHHFLVLGNGGGNRIRAVRWFGDKRSYTGESIDMAFTISSSEKEPDGGVKLTIENFSINEHKAVSEKLSSIRIVDERSENIECVIDKYPDAVVFYEGFGMDRFPFKTYRKNDIREAKTLILLSIPADIGMLKEIVHMANPETLVLNFSANSDYEFKQYITNVLGAAKYVINHKNGITNLQDLCSLLCVEENILKTSFTYLRNYGKIEFELDIWDNGIIITKGTGIKTNESMFELESSLKEALRNKRSYQQYMMNIDIDKLYEIIRQRS